MVMLESPHGSWRKVCSSTVDGCHPSQACWLCSGILGVLFCVLSDSVGKEEEEEEGGGDVSSALWI